MNYLEIIRMIKNYTDYIYIYMNYLEILIMITTYNDYIYIYIYIYTNKPNISKYSE